MNEITIEQFRLFLKASGIEIERKQYESLQKPSPYYYDVWYGEDHLATLHDKDLEYYDATEAIYDALEAENDHTK